MDLIARTEARRLAALSRLDPDRQATLGQFFTPAAAATLVASLPRLDGLTGPVRVLDPGAGAGSLTAAMVTRLAAERPGLAVHVVAVETDPTVVPVLAETLEDCERLDGVTCGLVEGDFIMSSTGMDPDTRVTGPFDLVIMNPPYGKLAVAHHYRRAVGNEVVDTPNLYAAFWALAVRACAPGGQCVVIVPRSFANGSYFEPFRRWLLDSMRLDTLHVFESRSTVFADTGVLQENVIVSGTTRARQGRVVLSASHGHADDVTRQEVLASAVVQPDDPHRFIRFTDGVAAVAAAARFTLADLGLTVSTGRVVDFRVRDWLSDASHESGTAPLVYPGNFRGGGVEWPRSMGKPQALSLADDGARKLLVPAGCYTLTKRFSAKEERRRVVAAVWDRPGEPAFENHLNYFHESGQGLPPDLARGLSMWLNSTPVDDLFRSFSGHTQVNASDLRTLPYPSREDLTRLGRAIRSGLPGQDDLDAAVASVLAPVEAVA